MHKHLYVTRCTYNKDLSPYSNPGMRHSTRMPNKNLNLSLSAVSWYPPPPPTHTHTPPLNTTKNFTPKTLTKHLSSRVLLRRREGQKICLKPVHGPFINFISPFRQRPKCFLDRWAKPQSRGSSCPCWTDPSWSISGEATETRFLKHCFAYVDVKGSASSGYVSQVCTGFFFSEHWQVYACQWVQLHGLWCTDVF